MAKRSRRQRRRRRTLINLLMLSFLLVSLLSIYALLRLEESGQPLTLPRFQIGKSQATPVQFPINSQVTLLKSAKDSDGQPYSSDLLSQVGEVIAQKEEEINGQAVTTYTVRFAEEQEVSGLLEEDLRAVTTPYTLGQEVDLVADNPYHLSEPGKITGIRLIETSGQIQYRYSAVFPSLGLVTDLLEEDFIWVTTVAFKASNTPAQNNALLQKAIDASKGHRQARIDFPSGRFLIGSQTPETDYLLLASNLELRGQETTLVVDGSARWFGLATGPGATDGVSHFTMQGLTVEAKNLNKGNQFIVMLNHGQNIVVKNNRFTMVHQLSSHVFDLGGVQGAVFSGNIFEGYAPELTAVTEIGERSTHNFISEAIQLDASWNNGEWDGQMLQAIDPNYEQYNPERLESGQITISNNQFLPYYNKSGQLVAYGASIGQHSSNVGAVTIADNVFTATLSSRFINLVAEGDRWVFEPIHIRSTALTEIYGNVFND